MLNYMTECFKNSKGGITMGKLSGFIRALLKNAEDRPLVPLVRMWCLIQKEIKPCYEGASYIMVVKSEFGFVERVPVCSRHHPDKDFWVRRNQELKNRKIINVEEIRNRQ